MEFDRIVANVGYHADDEILRELQVKLCHVTGGPARFAKARSLHPAGGGSHEAEAGAPLARWPGPEALANAEPDFYILGAKSFGRDSRFLISMGLAQIRDLFTILGDRAELDLYATMPSAR
jgi:hypothetical protein